MRLFLLFGLVRNILSISIISLLHKLGFSVSFSLLLSMIIGFLIYNLQIKYTIGKINLKFIILVFISIYLLNRFLLWVLYENLKIDITLSQTFIVVSLSMFSYYFLKSKREV